MTLGSVDNLLRHACAYAEQGFEVFPVNPRDKTPYVSQYQATTRLAQLDVWWSEYPDALIGHRLDEDVLIIDVDPRHGGRETWNLLKEKIGGWPFTRAHISGRGDGGGHLWWQMPADRLTISHLDGWAEEHGTGHAITDRDGNRVRWSCGLDLLHRNHRYTILPPSPHPDTGQPYGWLDGRGPEVEPGALPQLLVDLLVDDAPPPPARPPQPPDPTSIADWYSATATWGEILPRHGWRLVAGDGDSDGARWRHPSATSRYSATVRYGCLFVYSPNTPFEVTTPESPHGYTRFAAWALLDHQGDQSRAAGEARKRKGPDPIVAPGLVWPPNPPNSNGSAPVGPSPGLEPSGATVGVPEDFWGARGYLAHLRQAAHSRRRSAPAVLQIVLARVASIAHHTNLLPPIVGTAAPLCYFACIVSPPGVGKSSANGIAAELVPAPPYVLDQMPIGSGEGLAELLFESVKVDDPDKPGKTVEERKQTRNNVFVFSDEGEQTTSIGGRAGSTLLPTLRSIWSGGAIGQSNASEERRRIVPARSYSYGIVLALQGARAGALLGDVDAGTPQRFGWAAATDSTVPDVAPEWPGVLPWKPPAGSMAGAPPVLFDIAPSVQSEVREADLARVRGQIVVDPLDAHSGLLMLKTAALLAILDGRRDVNEEDWQLAKVVKAASDETRSTVVATVEAIRVEKSAAATRRHIERETATDEAKERRRIVECARKVVERVGAKPGELSPSDLRRDLRRWRDVANDAVDHAIAEGWIEERDELVGPGRDRKRLYPK